MVVYPGLPLTHAEALLGHQEAAGGVFSGTPDEMLRANPELVAEC